MLTGQSTSKAKPLLIIAMMRALTGPMRSANWPNKTRPSAEERLKPETSAAEDIVDRPNSFPYSGRKKGGTMSGRVAMADAMKMVVNRTSLNSLLFRRQPSVSRRDTEATHHSIVAVLLRPGRSLTNSAAGTTQISVKMPRIRRHQATPTFVIRYPRSKAMTPPPRPPLD